MSGHSKWANIQHKKGVNDARRGKMFSMIAKEITIAARMGGGDPGFNTRLRTAIAKAKSENMPADNITRAVKKGTGEIPGISYEEIVYEGYGPAGIGMIVEVTTDNKNRSASDVRSIFTKHGGSLAGAGAVAFNFQKKGQIIIAHDVVDEEKLMDLVLKAGAEDMKSYDTHYEILTDPYGLSPVVEALEKAAIPMAESQVAYLPTTIVPADESAHKSLDSLVEALEESDDVQHVWTNAEETEA
jgi:YebC/PmpR family DNA-binding regulatory protein